MKVGQPRNFQDTHSHMETMRRLEYDVAVVITRFTTAFSGLTSTICSSLLIFIMISDRKRKLLQPSNRFLISMSILDVCQSIGYTFSSIPVPKDSGYYGAFGNDVTCSLQGFVLQLGLGVPCYNASLCLWYLMSIRYNMKTSDFSKVWEPICHAVSVLGPLTTAIICAALERYEATGAVVCWLGDQNSSRLFIILISGASFVAVSTCIIVYSLCSVLCSIADMERKLKVRGMSGAQLYGYNCPDKKDALKQAILFSGALFLTFLFPTINIICFYRKSHGDPNYYSPMEVPQSIFLPLQGMWNFVIYVRRAVARIQEDYPEMSYGHAFKNLLCHPDRVAPPINTGRRRRRSSHSSSNRRFSAASTSTAAGQVQNDIENNSESLSLQKESSFCAGVAASKELSESSSSIGISFVRRSSFCAPAGKFEEALAVAALKDEIESESFDEG